MAEHSDSTFRTYRPLQAQQYAQNRTSYPLALYNHVLEYHHRTALDSGVAEPFGVLLDVGCGPGNATRDLAPAFDRAVGVDPGTEMIRTAQKLGGKTRTGEQVQFENCAAEDCASAPGIKEGEVDLLVAAMAAHWFDMPKFWQQAATIVKRGGTVAIWTISPAYPHPSTPHAEEIAQIIVDFTTTLLPYEAPGNRLSAEHYDNLVLPWTADQTQTAFPLEQFRRDEWDRDGVLTGTEFFGEPQAATLDLFEKILETVSMVTRWREAHPELVGTDKDCVKETILKLRPLVGDGKFKIYGGTVILFFKRA